MELRGEAQTLFSQTLLFKNWFAASANTTLHPSNFLHSISPPRFPRRVMNNSFEPSPSPPSALSWTGLENWQYSGSAFTFLFLLEHPQHSPFHAQTGQLLQRSCHAELIWITPWHTLNQKEGGILKQLLSCARSEACKGHSPPQNFSDLVEILHVLLLERCHSGPLHWRGLSPPLKTFLHKSDPAGIRRGVPIDFWSDGNVHCMF